MGMQGQAKPFQPEEKLKQNYQFIMGGAAGFNNSLDLLNNNQQQGFQQSKRGVQGRQPHGQQQQSSAIPRRSGFSSLRQNAEDSSQKELKRIYN